MMENYLIMEKTYDVFDVGRYKTVITYDLPIYRAIRFDFDCNLCIERIGHDELLELEKTKIFITILNDEGAHLIKNHEFGFEFFTEETFPSKWNNVSVKIHIPGVSHHIPSTMEIDFKNHDRVLLIGDEKFYVNSGLLSVWSDFFAALFKGSCIMKDKHGIPVSDVDAEEFKELLKIIYPTRQVINKDNVVFIWKLALRFEMSAVSHMCEEYLTTLPGKYSVSMSEKYELALFVDSDKLLTDCRQLLAKMSLGN